MELKQLNICGGCTECCYTLGIEELGKTYFTHCKHQKKSSCGIYGNHPESCRKYMCLYLTGVLGDEVKYRPDNLGFLFHVYKEDNNFYTLEIFETQDCTKQQWINMNFPMNAVLQKYHIDLIKIFCYQTKVATTFPSEMQDYKNIWAQVHKEPIPVFILLSCDDLESRRKIASLIANRARLVTTGSIN